MQKATAPVKKETVTLRHLAADLAESHGLPKAKTSDCLRAWSMPLPGT